MRQLGAVVFVAAVLLSLVGEASAATIEQATFMAGDDFDVYRANLDGSSLDRLTSCGTNDADCIYYWVQ
jgi:hypothetical protein